MVRLNEKEGKAVPHQDAVNPIDFEEGDYVRDGLVICGKCGGKKQCRVEVLGRKMIVPCVCKCRRDEMDREARQRQERERARTVRNLKSLSLMTGRLQEARFDRYVRTAENEKVFHIAKNYAEKFDEMKGHNQGLLLYGPVGTGKSYTAACIANALLEQSHAVVMTSFVKLLQDFRDEEAEKRFVQFVEQDDLIIIDDLGAERNTDFALEQVYNVIDSRVRANLPMILTTNMSMDEMERTKDIRYRRIYDRIFEVCYPVEFTGGSLRGVQAEIRRKKMKEVLES